MDVTSMFLCKLDILICNSGLLLVFLTCQYATLEQGRPSVKFWMELLGNDLKKIIVVMIDVHGFNFFYFFPCSIQLSILYIAGNLTFLGQM